MKPRVLLAVLILVLAVQSLGAQRMPTRRRPTADVFEIGGESAGDPDRHTFTSITAVAPTRNGYLIVLDSVRGRLHVLGLKGERLWHFAIDEPGDVSAPTDLTVTDSTISIRDAANDRWQTFTLQGTRLRSEAAVPVRAGRDMRRPMRDGMTVVERSPAVTIARDDTPADDALFRAVGIQRPHGGDIEWLFRIRTDSVVFRLTPSRSRLTPWRSSISPTLNTLTAARFGAGGVWAVASDSVLVHADGYTGEVTWYRIDSTGASVRERARQGRAGRTVTPEELANEVAHVRDHVLAAAIDTLKRSQSQQVASLHAVPRRWSVATRALFATDGSLWVGINRLYDVAVPRLGKVRVGDENTWAVFAADGGAWTVTLRPLFRLLTVDGDRLYGVIDDGSSAPALVAYALR